MNKMSQIAFVAVSSACISPAITAQPLTGIPIDPVIHCDDGNMELVVPHQNGCFQHGKMRQTGTLF